VTDAIELAVGVVCLTAAVATWHRGVKVVSAVLAFAGIAAVGHAVWSMAA
jgi:hypothetical protein